MHFVLINFLVAFGFIFFTSFLSAIINYDIYTALENNKTTLERLKMWGLMMTLVPFVEELAFRLLLQKSKLNYIVSISLILLFIFTILSDPSDYLPFINELPFKFIGYIPILLLLLLLSYLSYTYLFKDIYISVSVKKLLYATSILFAILHFSNYKNIELIHIILFPLLIAHHFIFGVFAGYLRLKLGFKWAVYFHALTNVIAVFFMAIKHFSELYISN
ncbi:CPBP family glutamic-type intramembrane protease [Aquimarina sp. ERC-38]|uniref:CPBP family glutamic-type intramembrane protease n=1 Tax=Aquimarina sp. ERC-38 TaxID=2949996 RepID=UPI002245F298|nr:CPBP family glutamic-type intramembrane protease [Aquimarina sp. ERC-38]UZO82343.1 CPBP family glutamic-type intramembrane protease [Aquimarina sp. ERC-38]